MTRTKESETIFGKTFPLVMEQGIVQLILFENSWEAGTILIFLFSNSSID